MRKVISRPDLSLPELPLPVHIRSVGYNEAEYGWGERADGGRKNFVQVFWCVGGCGELVLEGRNVRLKAGEVTYHLPGEDHIHRSVDPDALWRYHWVTFDGPGAADFMRSYGYPRKECFAGATEILALAGERYAESREAAGVVRRFIELAHRRFQEAELTVGELAGELGIHRTTLNRLFLRSMRLSPGAYLEQIRIQKALSLLRESSLSIKEIAGCAGFSHVSYFCEVIRKKTGMTPGEYRLRSGLD